MGKEGLVKGVRGNRRHHLMLEHRMNKYLHAMDLLFEGKATPEYVNMRGKKLKEVRR